MLKMWNLWYFMFLSSVGTTAFSQSIIEIEIKWKNVYTTTIEDITAKCYCIEYYIKYI